MTIANVKSDIYEEKCRRMKSTVCSLCTLPFALFLKLQVTTPSDQNVAAGEHVCLVAG